MSKKKSSKNIESKPPSPRRRHVRVKVEHIQHVKLRQSQERYSKTIENNEVTECDSKSNLKIVDLTGAGDLFAAGFLHGFINNFSIKSSLEKGTDMSSKIIQKIGARLN